MKVMQSVGSDLPRTSSNDLRSLSSFLMGLSDEKLAEWLTRREEGLNEESIRDRQMRLSRERREAEEKNKSIL